MMKNDGIDIRIKLSDLIRRCEKQYSPQFTGFLTLEEQAVVKELCAVEQEIFYVLFGGFSEAERCVVGLFPADYYSYPEDQIRYDALEELAGLEYIEISGSGFVNINHRDVLGSLMSLGIKRETIGDIYVTENSKNSYVVVTEGIAEYIVANLDRVARDKVKISTIDKKMLPTKKQGFADMSLTLASIRLDALVSGMLNLSRDKAKRYISQGRVSINHKEVQACDREFSQGDIISVKGEGRFLVDSFLGTTAKNRFRVIIRKYL